MSAAAAAGRATLAALGALGLALLGACASSAPPQRHFVLRAEPAAARSEAASAPAGRASDAILLVAPVTASPFYDTREIVYSRAPGTLAYYQQSRWTEPPALAVEAALLEALRRSGAFREVVSVAAGVRGSLLLRLDLDEVYHDAATAPGTARIAVSAEVTDPLRRTLVARRSFQAAAPVPSHDADGAVAGTRAALGQVLAELIAWMRELPAR